MWVIYFGEDSVYVAHDVEQVKRSIYQFLATTIDVKELRDSVEEHIDNVFDANPHTTMDFKISPSHSLSIIYCPLDKYSKIHKIMSEAYLQVDRNIQQKIECLAV